MTRRSLIVLAAALVVVLSATGTLVAQAVTSPTSTQQVATPPTVVPNTNTPLYKAVPTVQPLTSDQKRGQDALAAGLTTAQKQQASSLALSDGAVTSLGGASNAPRGGLVVPWFNTPTSTVVGAAVLVTWATPIAIGAGLPHTTPLAVANATAAVRPYTVTRDPGSFTGVTSAFVFVDLTTLRIVDIKPSPPAEYHADPSAPKVASND
jgi:hypothetical protein